MRDLKRRAEREKVPLTELVNRVLRRGLEALGERRPKVRRPYREQVFSLGVPRVPLEKALALAGSLEDAEVLEELARRQ